MGKPIIIAEIGINHGGNMDLALEMIISAYLSGADMVKFQLYDPKKLLDEGLFTPQDWQEILKAELTFEQVEQLATWCQVVGIEFMASAFDLERLAWLEKLNVKRHKIASRMIYSKEYCQAVMDTGKPYLVSNGFMNKKNPLGESVRSAFLRLDKFNPGCNFLYCVSKYPTPLKDVKFNFETFKFYSGFSDHTVGLTASMTALALGAHIIEKHFTLDRDAPGPDQKGSMTPDELKVLCQYRDELMELGSY